MMTKDVALVGRAMSDIVIEPVRTRTLPGYETVRTEAFKVGAVGVVLRGVGPSVAAFFNLNECDLKVDLECYEERVQSLQHTY